MSDFFRNDMRSSNVIASAMSPDAGKYAPLPLESIRVAQPVSFDLYLKMKDQKSDVPQMVRCCVPGDVFQKDWYGKLEKLKIQWLYFALSEVDQVFAYLQQNLESLLKDENHSEAEKAKCVCDMTQVWVMRFFTNDLSRTGDQINLALNLVDDLMDAVKRVDFNSLMLLELSKQNIYIYSHSVSCCLLGLAFVNYLGWNGKKARNFGLGALIHDIGYARLPRELLEKKSDLTEDDIIRIQRHPIEGFRMLQSFAHIPWEALQMVLRHHENGDGSGYPEGVKLNAIHPWARIMHIIDSYEELTGERPGHAPIPPKEALWIMRQQWEEQKLYDHKYLMSFISFLAGLAPGVGKGA